MNEASSAASEIPLSAQRCGTHQPIQRSSERLRTERYAAEERGGPLAPAAAYVSASTAAIRLSMLSACCACETGGWRCQSSLR